MCKDLIVRFFSPTNLLFGALVLGLKDRTLLGLTGAVYAPNDEFQILLSQHIDSPEPIKQLTREHRTHFGRHFQGCVSAFTDPREWNLVRERAKLATRWGIIVANHAVVHVHAISYSMPLFVHQFFVCF